MFKTIFLCLMFLSLSAAHASPTSDFWFKKTEVGVTTFGFMALVYRGGLAEIAYRSPSVAICFGVPLLVVEGLRRLWS